MEECVHYSPWNKKDPYPLATRECLSLDSRYGADLCVSPRSEHESKKCPWSGRPDKEVADDRAQEK